MRISVATLVFSVALDAGAAAPATDVRVASLAAGCAACHGTNGNALPQSPVAGLAGLRANRLRSELLAFKRGERPGTVMPQLAKGYTDAQIDELAAFFAAQSANRTP